MTQSLVLIGEKAKSFFIEHNNFDIRLFSETLDSSEQKLLKEFAELRHSFTDEALNENNINIYISQIKENVRSANILKALEEANKSLTKGVPAREVLYYFAKETEQEKASIEPANFWEAFESDGEWDDLITESVELGNSSTFSRGKIVTIAGDTGSIKTGVSIHMCLDLLRRNKNSKICYFQKELPMADMLIRLKSYFTQIENNKIKAEKSKVDSFFDQIKNGKGEKELLIKSVLDRFYIVDASKFYSVYDIESYMLATKADIYIIDYLALLASSNSDSGNFNDSVQKLCYQLKDFTVTQNLVGIVLTQLKKGTVETRTSKIPSMDDMEWSGALKQISSTVLVTYYPHLYYTGDVPDTNFYVLVKKGRYGQPINPISYLVDPKTHRFKYQAPGTSEQLDSIRTYEITLKGIKNGIR